jgi:CRISPR-associated protein Csm2
MSFTIDDFKPAWITDKLELDAILFAEKFGEHLCDLQQGRAGRTAMTTSQIRNFFGEVKRIQAKASAAGGFNEVKSSFLLIRPKLAYAEARAKAKGPTRLSDFRKVMEQAHASVNNDAARFQNFVDFMEAILAYHKFYGGL